MDFQQTPARRLSSAWTPVYKIVFPILWLGGILFFFLDSEQIEGSGTFAGDRWLFAVMMVGGMAMLYWFCIRLKWVDLRADMLIISDIQREITVPLHDVDRFSGSILISPEFIWIHFRRTTEFGDKVIFLAPWRFFQGFSPHPLVRELNGRRVQARPSPWSAEQT